MIDYLRTAGKVLKMIQVNGVEIEFILLNKQSSGVAWSEQSESRKKLPCLVLPISSGEELGLSVLMESLIPKGSIILLVPPTDADLESFDAFVYLGKRYGITKVETLAPTGTPVLHYVFADQ